MKMMAAIVEKFGYPLVIDQLEIPALKCGQVLVRIYCSGVCGAQLKHIAGVAR
jgi:D-arabinose 1-dehydrogenase-like Zn-dependent alcohol dehydrogenase